MGDVKVTRQIKRRTPEEIKRDEKMRSVCAEKVQAAIIKNWDEIRDAHGPVNIKLEVTDNSAAVSMSFLKSVTIDSDFVLDDGQEELPGTTTPLVDGE